MVQLYKIFISDEVLQKKFQSKYGKKYKLKLEMEYQYQHKSCKIDIGFTADKKAFWVFKYKGDIYMNIVEDVELKDKYTVIDLYLNLVENAKESYNSVSGLSKLRKNAIKRKK